MTKKTLKDLDSEFTKLRVDLTKLQAKFDDLIKKHEALGEKYSEVISQEIFKWKNCDATLGTLAELRKHRKVHQTYTRYSCKWG